MSERDKLKFEGGEKTYMKEWGLEMVLGIWGFEFVEKVRRVKE